jgi:aerobic carbon-monoxide dehydrogenase large subunit
MEPRGCVGDYDKTEGSLHAAHGDAAPHPFASRSCADCSVPESKVRIVGGDIGGSFGMKSASTTRCALVLLAVETDRPAGEVDQRRAPRPSSPTRRRATTSPTPNSRSTRRQFLGCASRRSAAIGAYCRPGRCRSQQLRHAGRRLRTRRSTSTHGVFTNTNPTRPYRGNGRPEAAYVIERLIDIAADELGIDPVELRRATSSRPTRCPTRPRCSSPTTAASSRRTWTWRSRSPTIKGFEARGRRRASAASCAASACPTRSSAPAATGFEGAEIRFDRTGT